ncbi:MAG TPA: GAF domain-containing protein, partial [Vicinamibacteria bacterium]
MSGTLAPLLLRIAAAVDGDGGAAVRGVLESVLQDLAPNEAGEIVYARTAGDHVAYLLGQAREAFLGRDLVEHVLAQGVPLRLDDLREAAPFPETHALLRRLGLRSVLVLPFRFGEPDGPRVRGAVALARSHGWAFAGASLPLLVPLAGLAGLAFDHALRLSAPGERAPAPVTAPPPTPVPPVAPEEAPEPKPAESEAAAAEVWSARSAAAAARQEADAARSLAEGLRAELEAARQDAVRAAEALREALEAGRALRSSVEAGEAGRLEAERSRDEWAQQAATLRSRAEE